MVERQHSGGGVFDTRRLFHVKRAFEKAKRWHKLQETASRLATKSPLGGSRQKQFLQIVERINEAMPST